VSGGHEPSCVCKQCCEARLSAQPKPIDLSGAKHALGRLRERGEKIEGAVEGAATRAGERRRARKDKGGWMIGVWWS
jgi:hypothetical protein